MKKCQMPPLRYERTPCHACGAATEAEAETKCRPSSDETGESWCGTDFDAEGYAVSPTTESLQAQDAWIGIHYDCFEECVADHSLMKGPK
jgi:hypothetical protein